MAHSHEHHHEHVHELTSLNKSFIIGITLNILFVLVEFGIGFYYDSLGLLSDAGHNLGDVASLVLAMLAFRLAKVHPNSRYTYGYKKSTVLVSLLNAVILLVAVGIIITESIEKLFHPVPVEGAAIAWTAGVGVVINAVTAWLFMKDKEKDLNVKGAYLHMAADTLVSVGVVISGIIIMYTGWTLVDPIIGLVIAVIIVISTWSLLHDSQRERSLSAYGCRYVGIGGSGHFGYYHHVHRLDTCRSDHRPGDCRHHCHLNLELTARQPPPFARRSPGGNRS